METESSDLLIVRRDDCVIIIINFALFVSIVVLVFNVHRKGSLTKNDNLSFLFKKVTRKSLMRIVNMETRAE